MTPCIDNYTDLSLRKYEEVIRANNIESEIDRQVKVISILTDLSEREVLNLPIAEYSELAGKALFLTKPMPKIPGPAKKYRVDGFTLVPTTDLRKITTAQYIDFQTYAPGADSKIVEILSCFLVPEGKMYNDGYDILEVQEAIRDLSVKDTIALSAFFLTKYANLIKATKISLAKAVKREKGAKRAQMEAQMARLTKAINSLTGGVG